jgi:hypothetical protein
VTRSEEGHGEGGEGNGDSDDTTINIRWDVGGGRVTKEGVECDSDGNEDGYGDGKKGWRVSDGDGDGVMVAGDEESDGDGDEGGGRAIATRAKVTAMRAMVMVTGVVCDKEARARVMPKAMRVVHVKEGGGSKATATATRVAGERWQWQRGWWVRKRARLARAMAMATKRRQQDGNETTTRRR